MSEQEQFDDNNDQHEFDDQDEPKQHDNEQQDRDDSDDQNNDDGDEYVVTFGDELPPDEPDDEAGFEGQPAPQWLKEERVKIREIKKQEKEKDRRIRELEQQLNQGQQQKEVELGEKPTLESSGYDSDEYEKNLAEWFEKKRSYDELERKKQAEQEQAAKTWQDKITAYETKKAAIKAKVRDFDDVEKEARDVLSVQQQGILIHAAKNPELIMYHLGRNLEKAKKLAEINDPIQFAFAAAEIDSQMKVQTRKPQTNPERKPSGSASISGAVDSKLEALEKEADRTGNRSKVIAYKKSLKNKESQ